MRPTLVALATAAIFTVCGTPSAAEKYAQLSDPVAVAQATKSKHDDFKKLTLFTGANASQYNFLLLRAWKADVTGNVEYQIFSTHFDTNMRFYSEAYDSNGNKLDFVAIDRRVDSCNGDRGCYYEETIGLNVSRDYLEKYQNEGIHYKISGKGGEAISFLPPAYVKGFLAAIDKAGTTP